jgi:ubiquinone/menaquinone biosynthesis C-methylase UbiE
MVCRLSAIAGKNFLSFLREGNYAHAGEEEAIVMALRNFPKNAAQQILDVGCGLGGTAKFVQDQGWGKVVGVDIEAESIEYANKHYPEAEFHQSDVVNVSEVIKDKRFDLIYLFNVFYAFPDHLKALQALRRVAKDQAQLIIFDYIDFSDNKCSFIKEAELNPLHPENTRKLLEASGWGCSFKLEDITVDYIRWYTNLVEKLHKKKEEAIRRFGQNYYDHADDRYTSFIKNFIAGNIGGAIVYAAAI